MNWIDVLNTVVGLTSLLIGGLAIWLSIHMYEKAVDYDAQTGKALEAIKAQSEALQRLTARWMDRFTRHATSPRPADEGLMQLVQVVASLPNTILATVDIARQPSHQSSSQQLQQEVAASHIALYFYTAISNVLAQGMLPTEDIYDPTDAFQSGVKDLVDSSAADFDRMANLLNGMDKSLITNSYLRHLLDSTIANWSPYVQYAQQAFAKKTATDNPT